MRPVDGLRGAGRQGAAEAPLHLSATGVGVEGLQLGEGEDGAVGGDHGHTPSHSSAKCASTHARAAASLANPSRSPIGGSAQVSYSTTVDPATAVIYPPGHVSGARPGG